MAHTLKIGGDFPVVPGLGLPAAFEALDKRLESTMQLCKLKGSVESQTLGMITVCQELQRLLQFAFIENGMLANRIEILTRYHNDTVKKMEKRMVQVEVEHKVTRKQMKRMRKRLYSHERLQKKRHGEWWDVQVSTSDYDSLTSLARSGGTPDLEFMLRVNQIMIDFVKDKEKTELLLPPMGSEERAELAKLASVYKLRCRFGKSSQLASSTLLKARQACIPAAGEVDAVLENFTKAQKRLSAEESGENQGTSTGKDPDKQESLESPQSELGPTMLTPISSLTVDMGGSSATPSQSPPASGLTSPTESAKQLHKEGGGGGVSGRTEEKGTAAGGGSENPLPAAPGGPTKIKEDTRRQPVTSVRSENSPRSGNPVSTVSGTSSSLSHRTFQVSAKPPPLILSSAGHHSASLLLPATSVSSSGGTHKHSSTNTGPAGSVFVHHHGQIRPLGHPTVVASPLKIPLTQVSPSGHGLLGHSANSSEGRRETEGKRESPASSSSGIPTKRLRITRKSISSNTEDEHKS